MRRIRELNEVTKGDYVLCTKYSDRDPCDQWQVGFLDYAEICHGKILFHLENPQRSYYKCCWLITPSEGDKIVQLETPKAARSNGQPKKAYRKSE